MRIPRLLTIAALVGVAACGEDNPSQPKYDPPGVTVRVDPAFMGPRDAGEIVMTVTPVRADPVQSAWLVLDAGGGDRDSVAFPLDGSADEQTAVLSLSIPVQPITATIAVIGRATSRSRRVAEDTAHFAIGDTVPPEARWVISGDTVHAGSQTPIDAFFADHSGLAREEVHVTGAVTRNEVYQDPGFRTTGGIGFDLTVPNAPGDSIVYTAIATDIYGLKTQIRQVRHIAP